MYNQLLIILALFVLLYLVIQIVRFKMFGFGSVKEHFVLGNPPGCPTCPSCSCPPCPVCPPDRTADVNNLTLLSKYLTLIIRKNEAQDEIFRLAQGHARVYTSPKLEQINRDIFDFKKKVQNDPATQKFFDTNLDSAVVPLE